ncbi:MAG TPA: 50S ribosomal protein L25 [Candidatus Paceibacterota bacterium]|nr:50S ribosomal protein L25 [Candidatus Paceibacterota bacterium]
MFKLSAKLRDILGKKVSELRRVGELPAVVYGGKEGSKCLTLNLIEFKKVLKEAGESSIISLELDGKKTDVLIHEVQFEPVTGEPVHADLYVVSQDKEIEVDVPLVFEGVPPAVKELGGSLVKVIHELPISALPKNLPHDIIVDVSVLKTLDSQILVRDLKLPTGVKAVVEDDEVVASITIAGEEVVDEVTPADLSGIEVEKKGKKDEEDGEGTPASE